MKDHILNLAFRFFVFPPASLVVGSLAVFYFGSGAHKHDRSGDGSLPFALGALGLGVGITGATVFGSLAYLLGVPALIAYPTAYWLTVGVGAMFL
jgi:hypothetical protein